MKTTSTHQLPMADLPEFFNELVKAPETGLPPVTRRQFMKLSGVAGGGLVLGLSLGVSRKARAQQAAEGQLASLSPYVQIQPNGRINIFSKNPECGQGIKTGLPLIIAEELDCRWEDVDVKQADIDAALYGVQFAGGSLSTPMNWMAMRQAGATARAMILAAAASRLNVPVSELSTREGKVIHGGNEYGYGEFAELAATMPVPEAGTLTLKDPSQFTLLGRRFTGVDNPAIVRGQGLFGIDQRLPGMVYASFARCPRIGGSAVSFNEERIKSLPGVIDAFIVEPFGDAKFFSTNNGAHFGGVAIIGRSTWATIKARRELVVEWDYSNAETASWSEAVERAYALAGQDGTMELKNAGDVPGALNGAAQVVEAFYEYPYVAHAPLEPENCTALYENGRIEIWAPSQVPQGGEAGTVTLLGLPEENVVLHQTRIGGGFGRKLANDYVYEVAAIARRLEGTPVKLTWTREDDMMHDYFRPGGFHAYRGALDADGRLIAWQDHFITFTGNDQGPMTAADMNPNVFPTDVLPNVKLTQTMFHAAIPTGPMRAPSSNAFAFVYQSFLHELSTAAGRDHVEFLLETLGEPRLVNAEAPQSMHTGRAANVIRSVAENAGWGREMPAGRALGLAFYFCHSGYVAQVAEVSCTPSKELTVHKVWAVADFGFIHNRSAAENQMEGGILDGLSQMVGAKITFENGAVQQTNFHQYPLLRIPQAPEIEVAFLEPAEFAPTGAGEPSMPPLLPAVANAIFAATGERVRKLPLAELGYRLV